MILEPGLGADDGAVSIDLRLQRLGPIERLTSCNEKLDLKFLGWVWNFGRDTKPRIEFRLREFARDIPVFRVRSAREANAFRLHTDSNA